MIHDWEIETKKSSQDSDFLSLLVRLAYHKVKNINSGNNAAFLTS